MEVFVRGLMQSLSPFSCFDIYREEGDLIQSGKTLMGGALRALDQAEKAAGEGDLGEVTAAKQHAQLSIDWANRALIEMQ